MQRSTLHSQARLARTRAIKAVRLASNPAHWPAARAGVLPSLEHQPVPFLDGIATVVDVGASRGQFAAFALQRFPTAQLICCEPLPEPRARLTEIVGSRGTVLPVAVGATAGTATFHISRSDDSSSLLPIGQRQVEEYPGTEEAAQIDVEVTTLDQLPLDGTPGPRLLKIDVQGGEYGVLTGGAQALGAFEQVFVECSFVELYEGQRLADEIIAFLLARGLRLRGVFGTSYDHRGTAIQADLLFGR